MTDHDRVAVNRNGTSVQLYFKARFAQDSQFPLDPGDEVVAYVTDAGTLHLVPTDELDSVLESPTTVDPPPEAAVPRQYRPPPEAEHPDRPRGTDDDTESTDNPFEMVTDDTLTD